MFRVGPAIMSAVGRPRQEMGTPRWRFSTDHTLRLTFFTVPGRPPATGKRSGGPEWRNGAS